jgi:hypothetical protein
LAVSLPIERISLREYRLADFLDMAMIRATATAEHVQIRELVAQLSVLSTELVGISDIELSGFVEFFMAFRRRVRSQAADSCRPTPRRDPNTLAKWLGCAQLII